MGSPRKHLFTSSYRATRLRAEVLSLCLVVTACVLVGLHIVTSRAAVPSVAVETENGNLTAPATKLSDTSASGGSAVLFGGGQAFGYSIHGVGLSAADLTPYLKLAVDSHANTVRDDFQWAVVEPSNGQYDWATTDRYMTQTVQLGLSVLAIADYTPSWESGNTSTTHVGPKFAADYGLYVGQLAMRYGANGTFWKQNPTVPYHALAGIEIWNEPNNNTAWASPNAAAYAAIVKAAYPAIKNVDPSITVLAGSAAPCQSYGYSGADCINGVTFLEGMYAAGAQGFFDAFSNHPYAYGPGLTASYILTNHPWSAWSQMTDTSVSMHSLMAAHGDGNKKIWATEIGAPTNSAGISPTEQANLATQSIAAWRTYSWAGNYYWYDVKDDCTDTSNAECNFGALLANGTAKAAYTALSQSYQVANGN
jgi:hypothetical protein